MKRCSDLLFMNRGPNQPNPFTGKARSRTRQKLHHISPSIPGKASKMTTTMPVPDLPDDVWNFLVEHHLSLPKARFTLRSVAHRFRDAISIPRDVDEWLAGGHPLPGLSIHASRSLLVRVSPTSRLLPRMLACAVKRKCVFCQSSYMGGFTAFHVLQDRDFLVYAHPACLRKHCITRYWLERPELTASRERLGEVLQAAAQRLLASVPEWLLLLPVWRSEGYHRHMGRFTQSLVLVHPLMHGYVPPKTSIWEIVEALRA